MLTGTLTLHNVNTEKLCTRIIKQTRKTAHLNHTEREDLLAYLIIATWKLSQRFDPSRNDSFENYAAPILKLRIVDWWRTYYHRTRWAFNDHTHQRDPIHITTLDRLDDPHTLRTSSHPPDSDPALTRMDTDRARHQTRDIHILDQRVPRRTTA